MRHRPRHFILFFLTFACIAASVPLSTAHGHSGLIITADMQFNYARQLYSDKDYLTAQVEFKRFIQFFPDDPRVVQAQFLSGMALFYSEKFYEAARQFDHIISQAQTPDAPWVRKSYFMISLAFESMGKIGFAQVVLQNYLKLTRDPHVKDRIYKELARINIKNTMAPGVDELNAARQNLTLISPERQKDLEVVRQLNAVDAALNTQKKSPVLSGIFSIIPGGGMLYCHRYQDAFCKLFIQYRHDLCGLPGL